MMCHLVKTGIVNDDVVHPTCSLAEMIVGVYASGRERAEEG